MVDTQKIRDEFAARLNKALDDVPSVRAARGRNTDLHELLRAHGLSSSKQATHKWLRAEAMPEKDNMRLIARVLGVRAEWLEYGHGDMHSSTGEEDAVEKESNVIAADFSQKRARDGEIDIPHYDVRAAMGAGQVLPSDYIETIRHVTVSLEFLRSQGVSCTQPDNLGMITGFGESMNKTFTSGDPLIIDKGVTSVVTDGVYLFTLSGALFVKRLQIIPGGIRVISDNDAYPPYDITGADLKHLVIHARVLLAWRSQRL
ncbi:S24 family peptidase [Halopseudomonas bauzanensis]|uniref:S24 family peptidase n=1 Tax=Halopseudomonas bauzanensis TaxID=653930 RepID=UPI0025553C4A|nr:LexA family transcriptional regulator [Halopseudomonas bauzanensis]